MTIVTKERALRRMQQTPVILNGILRGVSAEQARTATDGPDGWSVLEVVCHLNDFEQIFRERAERFVNEDEPAFPPIDEKALVVEHGYARQDFAGVLHSYFDRRREFLAFLAGLPDEAWGRYAIHARWGRMSLTEHALNAALHDVDHIEQISRALGLSPALMV